MILCDTDILIEFYKNNPEIIYQLRHIGQLNLAISAITQAELYFGALIVSSDLHRNYTSPVTAYIKAEIIFTNGTRLAFFQHMRKDGAGLFITDYRIIFNHYMTGDDQMIFRYDNAPHHPGTENFPHHKHTLSGVVGADMPEIRDVMNEITAMILSSDSYFG